MDNVNPYRNDTEGYCIEDLAVCISASFAKTVTEEDIWLFSSVSGDINPVHLDQAYAEKTRLKGRISHGMLSASFIAAVISVRLPGPGSIYVSQTFSSSRRCGRAKPSRQGSPSLKSCHNAVALFCRPAATSTRR